MPATLINVLYRLAYEQSGLLVKVQ